MLKKIAGLAIAFTLLASPFAEAGSFSGSSSTIKSSSSAPSTSSSSVNLSKTSTPSVSSPSPSGSVSGSFSGTSSTKTPSTTSRPSSATTGGSVKGSYTGTSSTNAPSVSGSKTPISTGYQKSNVTSSTPSTMPTRSNTQFGYVNGQRSFGWSSPSSFGTGLASGLLVGSLFHPWGGYYGTGNYYGYQPVSTVSIVIDLILLALICLLAFWIIRKIIGDKK